LSGKPLGKWFFSRLVGYIAPYTATIGARVEVLEAGHGVVVLKDRRGVRNHLRSVHAIALVNLAEMVTGLTLMNSLPDGMRGILTGIQISYLKKARGRLVAECNCEIPRSGEEQKVIVTGEIKDRQGDAVAVAQATWLIGPE